MSKKYNTPKRNRYIRARLTDDEKADFDERKAASGLSQSDFIRQAVFHSKINLTVRTECSIDQLERMIAEYGKIGSNLNQIARHLNEGGTATSQIVEEVRSAALDLADLKYEILKIVGDVYGNN
jgi:hypothetical protein